MRIALYSPYLPKHRGGGEKYLLDVAASLLELGHETILAVSTEFDQAKTDSLIQDFSNFIGRDLSGLKIELCPLNQPVGWWQKLIWTSKFDGLYYQTDGSLFFSLAKKNILHIQIPFTQPKPSMVDRLKLINWGVKNTNSNFTKSVIEQAWQTKIGYVHYPMITPIKSELSAEFLESKKLQILHVGRFFKQLHCKHQEVLVEAFKQLITKNPALMKNWELVLVGTIEDEDYAAQIHHAAKNFPIKFVHEASRDKLLELYQSAKIYWHATGFGENETSHPEKMEHFGISTIEAMSAGAAPVVINKGGQKEIMTGELSTWTWLEVPELVTKTASLIESTESLAQVQHLAHSRSLDFSPATFRKTLERMIK